MKNSFTRSVLDFVADEPVMSAVCGFVAAAYFALTTFDISLTTEQAAALGGVGLAAIAVAKAVRERVSPTSSFDEFE